MVLYGVIAAALAGVAAYAWWPATSEPAVSRQIQKLVAKNDAPALVALAKTEAGPAAAEAVLALSTVGQRADVEPFVKDQRPEVRAGALDALARVGDRRNVAIINEVLANKTEDVAVRASAAKTLGELRSWNGLETLIEALADKDRYVRGCAHAAIERITTLRFDYKLDGTRADFAQTQAAVRKAMPVVKAGYEQYMRRLEKEKQQ